MLHYKNSNNWNEVTTLHKPNPKRKKSMNRRTCKKTQAQKKNLTSAIVKHMIEHAIFLDHKLDRNIYPQPCTDSYGGGLTLRIELVTIVEKHINLAFPIFEHIYFFCKAYF